MATLKNYFDVDFPGPAIVQYELQVESQKTKESINIFAQAHIDFIAHLKFCSFYIPEVEQSELLEYFKAALAYSRDVIALRRGKKVTLPKTFGAWTGTKIEIQANEYLDMALAPLEGGRFPISDFGISPVIYIYCEQDLTPEELSEVILLGKRYNSILRVRGPMYAEERTKTAKPVAFISHDSRDKDEIARPLAQQLMAAGYSVWFDEFSLKPGDKLRESIEKGIKECSKCILVLTPNFLGNNGWGKTEFNSVFTREILEESNIVIPVWHNIEKKQVYEYSPSLLNIVGEIWNKDSPEKSVHKIIQSLENDENS